MQLNSKEVKKLIESQYEEILNNPTAFARSFKTLDEFKVFCNKAMILDLEELLKVFYPAELDEDCDIIIDILENKLTLKRG